MENIVPCPTLSLMIQYICAVKETKGERIMENKKRIITAALVASMILASVPAVSAGTHEIDDADVGKSDGGIVVDTSVSNTVAEEPVIASEEVQARAIPSGAQNINLNVNGRSVLHGRVFSLGGVTYVPMFAFADWLGNFTYFYTDNGATAIVEGENLIITAHEGDLYIIANGRYFYTGREVISFGGVTYVPILPMTKALNSKVEWNDSMGGFVVRNGDTRLLKTAAQVYREDHVFWLARIITAEAQGEPLKGKMAVGNVVLNRVNSPAYPNTIYSVIFDRRYGTQFSPVDNGTIYNTPTEESIIAAKMCLEGYTISDSILYFVNPKLAPNSWAANNRPYAFTIGNHAFFD